MILILITILLLMFNLIGRVPIDTLIKNKQLEAVKNVAISDYEKLNISRVNVDLDLDGTFEVIQFYSPPVNLEDGVTNIFVNNQNNPEITLNGYFIDSHIYNIKKGLVILEVQVMVGKSINSLVYQYKNQRLERISVSTENSPSFEGIVSRSFPEFKDLNKDGVLEMLAYYRYFPPEAKRTVEVYKFDGEIFSKVQEYEEETKSIYY